MEHARLSELEALLEAKHKELEEAQVGLRGSSTLAAIPAIQPEPAGMVCECPLQGNSRVAVGMGDQHSMGQDWCAITKQGHTFGTAAKVACGCLLSCVCAGSLCSGRACSRGCRC